MCTLKRWIKTSQFKFSLLFSIFIFWANKPAFADLVSGMNELQSSVNGICRPLAIIFLIIAGWQKAMGNSQLFIAALVGTVIMFAAPQIVSFISASFGGG